MTQPNTFHQFFYRLLGCHIITICMHVWMAFSPFDLFSFTLLYSVYFALSWFALALVIDDMSQQPLYIKFITSAIISIYFFIFWPLLAFFALGKLKRLAQEAAEKNIHTTSFVIIIYVMTALITFWGFNWLAMIFIAL